LDGNGEDPVVLERLICRQHFPRREADARTRSPCATNSKGVGYEVSTVSEAF
jgi:hypothetical protein